MIRVTVEMLPGGDTTQARTISIVHVSNMSDLAEVSDYQIGASVDQMGGRIVGGVVTAHRRSHGWATLLARVFQRLADGGVR